jgi:hypothetical protein
MRIFFAGALLFLVACNNADKKEAVNVTGAWKMLSQHIKQGTTDTTYTNIQQLKIFTGDHMMYANVDPKDSSGSFGVGSYAASADTITEHVVYNASGANKDDTARTFHLVITKSDKGYKQLINQMATSSQPFALTEEYEATTGEAQTPLDGLWKLSKAITIRGKDTTVDKITQYKAYYAGHVIWGHTYTDSLNKNHTGIGFGTFAMNGNNKAKENMVSSTYSQVTGQSFDLDISTNGADEFTQTIVEKDGTKGIETYQRVK